MEIGIGNSPVEMHLTLKYVRKYLLPELMFIFIETRLYVNLNLQSCCA